MSKARKIKAKKLKITIAFKRNCICKSDKYEQHWYVGGKGDLCYWKWSVGGKGDLCYWKWNVGGKDDLCYSKWSVAEFKYEQNWYYYNSMNLRANHRM